MASPSHSPEQVIVNEEKILLTPNPNSPKNEETQLHPQQVQTQPQAQSQSPETLETTEIPEPQNPEKSDANQEAPQVLEEEEEQQSGMFLSLPPPPPTLDLKPPTITSPTHNPHRRGNKRKKGGMNVKKQQAIEKKVQVMLEKLNPIPFIPYKTLDFPKHEKLLKRLGLWDFVHIEFDRDIRPDLLAQLIVTYDKSSRCSYVNGYRILVNRSDFARAIKLPRPAKKEKSGNLVEGCVDVDLEAWSEESIIFVEDLLSNWVLLHEDTWLMPVEVFTWAKMIKEGQPEKVDWACLFWFMVENELNKGVQLVDCYYASHLQYLMKSQREELCKEPVNVESDLEVKEEEVQIKEEELQVKEEEVQVKEGEDSGLNEMRRGEHKVALEEPNIELTLGGQDTVDKEEMKNDVLMDVEQCKEEEEQVWDLAGKSNQSEHFLQRCSFEEDRDLDSNMEREPEVEDGEEVEEEEEEAEDGMGCDVAPNYESLERDDLTGNLLQGFETSHLPFTAQEQLHGQSSLELLASRVDTHMIMGGSSMFGNGSKRVIEHEQDISHINGGNKRMRTDVQWDHKSSDIGMCIGQAQQLMEKAKIMYEAKEQAFQESNMNQQFLIGELQRRESLIEHFHKVKFEELQKKDGEIFRLERELYVMGNLLDGYRKALKETNKAFFDYRQRCLLPEEPLYKDAGPGGLVLSITELEKQRQKREEEDRLNRSMMEQKFNEALEDYLGKFEVHLEKVQMLSDRLTSFEDEVKLLREMSANRKASENVGGAPSE